MTFSKIQGPLFNLQKAPNNWVMQGSSTRLISTVVTTPSSFSRTRVHTKSGIPLISPCLCSLFHCYPSSAILPLQGAAISQLFSFLACPVIIPKKEDGREYGWTIKYVSSHSNTQSPTYFPPSPSANSISTNTTTAHHSFGFI